MSSSDQLNSSPESPELTGNKPILVSVLNGDVMYLAKPLVTNKSLYMVSKDTLPHLPSKADLQDKLKPPPSTFSFQNIVSLENKNNTGLQKEDSTPFTANSEEPPVFIINRNNSARELHWELLKKGIEPPRLNNLNQLYYILVKVFFNVPIFLDELRMSKFGLHILVELLMRKNKNSAYKM